jgi:predicted methyltransferase
MKHSLFSPILSPLQPLFDARLSPGALRLMLISLLAWGNVQANTLTAQEDSRSESPQERTESTEALESAIRKVLSDPHRAESRNRDQYRHPAATLAFFEVSPSMSVAEIWPGASGWYSEILAPYLKEHGHYFAAQFPHNTDVGFFTRARTEFTDKTSAQPDLYSKMQVITFDPSGATELATANSLDRVLTFRNVHNWYMHGEDSGVLAALNQFYSALKPGGLLGVVDHRLAKGRPLSDQKDSGYMSQDYVIEMAQKVGFELVASSEINANPLDTSMHPAGVWTLPPTLRQGDTNRDLYRAIGESDRMTLKFRKPLQAIAETTDSDS